MVDYKAEYEALSKRQKELLDQEKTPEGLSEAQKEELRVTIAKKSSLQERILFPH